MPRQGMGRMPHRARAWDTRSSEATVIHGHTVLTRLFTPFFIFTALRNLALLYLVVFYFIAST